jgi:hypothetical protein
MYSTFIFVLQAPVGAVITEMVLSSDGKTLGKPIKPHQVYVTFPDNGKQFRQLCQL